MNTIDTTYIRNSSIYITDAISCESFVNEPRFHNNLYLASNYAQANGLNVQNNADKVGLMPYQYELSLIHILSIVAVHSNSPESSGT